MRVKLRSPGGRASTASHTTETPASQPPSTTNGCPVTYEESAQLRKSTSRATSSGLPIRPCGTSLA